MSQTAVAQKVGRVVQVIGPVIDIEFAEGLPEIYNAVRIVSEGGPGVEKIDVSPKSSSTSVRTACVRLP